MSISMNTICWIFCSECRAKWTMTYGAYTYEFIERKCPTCGFMDTRNSLLPKTKEELSYNGRRGIFMKEIEH